MGQIWSKFRRRRRNSHLNQLQLPPSPNQSTNPSVNPVEQFTTSATTSNGNSDLSFDPVSCPPQANTLLPYSPHLPASSIQPPLQASYAFATQAPFPTSLLLPPPPSIPSKSSNIQTSNSLITHPMIAGYTDFRTFYSNEPNVWGPYRPSTGRRRSSGCREGIKQAPYVEPKTAKKIKNDVNVHKDTIEVVLDEKNLGSYLVSFSFDAVVDGSFTIFYFAKESPNCVFTPLYPEIYMPKKIPFRRGLRQKICQPSGTGIDGGYFDWTEIFKPSPNGDIFPLVIHAETCAPMVVQPVPLMSPHAQITQAVLERNNDTHYQVKVIKQILWVDKVRYELLEIYGIDNLNEADFGSSDQGTECVICMTDPKDIAVLPCQHMCLCSACAKELRFQSNKCPICRKPIQELIEIKVNI